MLRRRPRVIHAKWCQWICTSCDPAAWSDLGGDEGVRDDAAPHESPTDDIRPEIIVRASGELLAGQHPRASSRLGESTTPLVLRSPSQAARGLVLVVGYKSVLSFQMRR